MSGSISQFSLSSGQGDESSDPQPGNLKTIAALIAQPVLELGLHSRLLHLQKAFHQSRCKHHLGKHSLSMMPICASLKIRMWLMKNCSAFLIKLVQRLLWDNSQSTDRKQLRSAISILSRSHPDNNMLPDCVATLSEHNQFCSISSVAFHPTAPILATSSEDCTENTVKLWRLSSDNSAATCVAILTGHGKWSYVTSVAFHPNLPLLATSSKDGTVKLWRLSSDNSAATCVATLMVQSETRSVAFHPTLPLMATGSSDKTAKLWQLSSDHHSATCVATLSGHNDWVCSVAFHLTLPILATGSHDNTAKVWQLSSDHHSATCVATLIGHSDLVNSVAFHPTKPILATAGSFDRTTKLWRLSPDSPAATCVATLKGHTGWVNSVAFHPNTPLLATGSRDGTTKLWRLNSDDSGASCVATLADSVGVCSIAFHPTKPILATGSNKGNVKLWC
jgi:WD40 repeat protein